MVAAIKEIIAKASAKGVKIGCFADTVEGGKKWRDLGVKFIGYGCDTYGDSEMYFPVILFGRYRQEGQALTLPFNIWVHHAVADGWHIHLLVDTLQQLLAEPESWLDS